MEIRLVRFGLLETFILVLVMFLVINILLRPFAEPKIVNVEGLCFVRLLDDIEPITCPTKP